MPDHRTARPSGGGYRDRTGDLLLAKAQDPVHTGARQGTEPASVRDAAAAAATRKRTAPESFRESLPADVCGRLLLEALREYERETVNQALRDLRDHGHGWPPTENGRARALAAALLRITSIDWPATERHARALDRSDAAHHLRVRHHQATRAQAHVRTAVGW